MAKRKNRINGRYGQRACATKTESGGETGVIIAIILAPVLASAAPSDDYVQCLRTETTGLENSGESPTTVARAVITACRSLEPRPTPENLLGQSPFENQRKILDELRQAFADRIVLRVIRVRACRRTPGCSIRTVPWSGDL